MKKFAMFAIVCTLAMGLAAPTAVAYNFTIGDAYYIGWINSAEAPNMTNESGYINYLTTLAVGAGPVQLPDADGQYYDRIGSTLATPGVGWPAAIGITGDKTEGGVTSGNLGSGWTYLFGKYNGPNSGAAVWYVYGLTGDFTMQATAPGNDNPTQSYGLSHYTLYNPTSVPDGGMTLMLLGGALIGLEGLRRKLRV
jgi:hypothetical protein